MRKKEGFIVLLKIIRLKTTIVLIKKIKINVLLSNNANQDKYVFKSVQCLTFPWLISVDIRIFKWQISPLQKAFFFQLKTKQWNILKLNLVLMKKKSIYESTFPPFFGNMKYASKSKCLHKWVYIVLLYCLYNMKMD